MKIQVVGSGCKSCKTLLENTQNAVKTMGLDAQIEYVTDVMKIMQTGVLRTPGLIVDGKIVLSGKVPKEKEIIDILKAQ